MGMTTREIVEKWLAHYTFALEHDFIQKPISYAFYYTWKYCDEHEKPRKKVADGSN